jgi:hypothetical protein
MGAEAVMDVLYDGMSMVVYIWWGDMVVSNIEKAVYGTSIFGGWRYSGVIGEIGIDAYNYKN